MANIGTLAAKLTLNPDQWISGLEKATRKLVNFTGSAGKLAAAPANLVGKIFSAPLRAVQSFLAPIQSLLTSIPMVGGALAAIPLTGAGFFEFLERGMSRVLRVGEQAKTFGIQTERMGSLMAFAGDSGEVLTNMLAKMGRTLGSVAAGDAVAGRAFRQLGLDAAEISKLPLDEALLRVSEALRRLPSEAERSRAAFDIFGRMGSTPEALHMLEKLKNFGGFETRHLAGGGATTAREVEQVREAKKAIAETGRALDRLQGQLAVQLAPYLKAAADWFNKVGLAGVDMGALVSDGLDMAIDTVSGLVTAVEAVIAIWHSAKLFVGNALYAIYAGVSLLVERVLELWQYLPDWLGGGVAQRNLTLLQNIRQDLGGMMIGIAQDAGHAWGRLFNNDLGERAHRALNGIRGAGAQARNQMNAELAQGGISLPPPDMGNFARSFNLTMRGFLAGNLSQFTDQSNRINTALAGMMAAPPGTNLDEFKQQIQKAMAEIAASPAGARPRVQAGIAELNRLLGTLGAGPSVENLRQQFTTIQGLLDNLQTAGQQNQGTGRNLYAGALTSARAELQKLAQLPAGADMKPGVETINKALASIQAPPGSAIAAEILKIRQALAQLQSGTEIARNFGLAQAALAEEADKIKEALPVEKMQARMNKLRQLLLLPQGQGLTSPQFQDQARQARDEMLSSIGANITTPVETYSHALAVLQQAQRDSGLSADEFRAAELRVQDAFLQNAGFNNWLTQARKMEERVRALQGLMGQGFPMNMGREIARARSELVGFDVETPIQHFQNRIADLDQWLMRGTIDANIYAAGIARAVNELDQSQAQHETKTAALLEGSREAYSAIAAHERGNQGQDPQERLRQILERARLIQEQQLQQQRQMAEALRAIRDRPGPARARI